MPNNPDLKNALTPQEQKKALDEMLFQVERLNDGLSEAGYGHFPEAARYIDGLITRLNRPIYELLGELLHTHPNLKDEDEL